MTAFGCRVALQQMPSSVFRGCVVVPSTANNGHSAQTKTALEGAVLVNTISGASEPLGWSNQWRFDRCSQSDEYDQFVSTRISLELGIQYPIIC